MPIERGQTVDEKELEYEKRAWIDEITKSHKLAQEYGEELKRVTITTHNEIEKYKKELQGKDEEIKLLQKLATDKMSDGKELIEKLNNDINFLKKENERLLAKLKDSNLDTINSLEDKLNGQTSNLMKENEKLNADISKLEQIGRAHV